MLNLPIKNKSKLWPIEILCDFWLICRILYKIWGHITVKYKQRISCSHAK